MKKNLLGRIVFLALFFGMQAQAAGFPILQSELIRLDGLRRTGAMSSQDKIRLAELYFLTSRCADVHDLLGDEKHDLNCACDGACKPDTILAKQMRLRDLLEKGVPWKSATVKTLWKELRATPGAQYVAQRALKRSTLADERALGLDLASELEAFDVRDSE